MREPASLEWDARRRLNPAICAVRFAVEHHGLCSLAYYNTVVFFHIVNANLRVKTTGADLHGWRHGAR